MNKRFLLALGAAAFCGLLAILVAQQYLQKELDDSRKSSDGFIVAAKVDIPAGAKITAEQVKLIPYRRSEIPADAVADLNDVVGRVARTEIPAQTPVLARIVTKPGDAANAVTDRLREGMRAVAVRVDEASSVAGFATPGNYVDIIAVLNPGGAARPVSKVILQNIRVLANGKQTQVRPDEKAVAGNTVTLEVTPAQGETLKLAEREGTLQLMLRSVADSAYTQTPGVVTRDVVDQNLEARARDGQNRAAGQSSAYIPPTPVAWSVPAAAATPSAKGAPAAASEAKPSPSPKVFAIEIIEGAKKQTVQVMN
jgi:pilus assembly protein CpaB